MIRLCEVMNYKLISIENPDFDYIFKCIQELESSSLTCEKLELCSVGMFGLNSNYYSALIGRKRVIIAVGDRVSLKIERLERILSENLARKARINLKTIKRGWISLKEKKELSKDFQEILAIALD